jgi:hypothetical protein
VSIVSINENSPRSLTIYDILGRYITKKEADENSSSFLGVDSNGKWQLATKFPLTGIPNGVYVIEYQIDTQIFKKRILIEN